MGIRLLPCLGYCTECRSEVNIRMHLSFWTMFFSGCMPKKGIAGPYDSSIFGFLRSVHTLLPSGCTSLHSHQFSSLLGFYFPWGPRGIAMHMCVVPESATSMWIPWIIWSPLYKHELKPGICFFQLQPLIQGHRLDSWVFSTYPSPKNYFQPSAIAYGHYLLLQTKWSFFAMAEKLLTFRTVLL